MADRFEGLSTFLAVARHRSFRRAAKELGVTAGAVSQAIRGLEARVGMPLFVRTTRSVSLTDAGSAFLSRVSPASDAVAEAFTAVAELQETPTGLLRITVPRLAVPLFVTPLIAHFRQRHPAIALEISVEDAFIDLGEGGFDAGIRIGDSIAKDMVAMRLSPKLRWCVVGAPSYFAEYGHPKKLRDLEHHTTIAYRRAGTNALYRWELVDRGRACSIDVSGAITVNDGALGLELARRGLGLLYTADIYIARDLAEGTLVTTLAAHAAESEGFFLYFPAFAQSQPKVRAFIETLKAM